MINYLQQALRNPNTRSLVLFDNYQEARVAFRDYTDEAWRLGLIIVPMDLIYKFAANGCLKFGYAACVRDLDQYRGIGWGNLFLGNLSSHGLTSHAIAHLHRPVYNGRQNGV